MKIVLAYSGGLDTSVAVPWLREKYGAEVVTVTLDLGQGRELADIQDRAIALGASRAHVLDAREEFAREYVLPALQAGAVYEQRYPLASALGRPLIAKHLVAVAAMEGATAVAHGGTAKGNDQVRLEVSVRALDPRLEVIAPGRQWGMTRSARIRYANARGITVPVTLDKPFSVDTNLWGRSIQRGTLEDPWQEPPEEIFTATRSSDGWPDTPAYVEVGFERGVPTSVNDVPMPLVDLIASLDTIAGAHGIGRIDMIENRVVGIKSREIYEAPAATVLHAAHRELEAMTLPHDLERLKAELAIAYADLVYTGLWFTPTREAIDAFVASVQRRVTGTVRLRLFRGQSSIVGRRAPQGVYDRGLATDDTGDTFDHSAAEGFIKIWGLPVETAARHATTDGRANQKPGK